MDVGRMSAYSLVWLKWRDIGAVAPAARLEVMVLFMTFGCLAGSLLDDIRVAYHS